METILKFIVLILTAFLAIWQIWTETEGKGKLLKIVIYSIMFICVLSITWAINNIDDNEKQKEENIESQQLLNSTKQLFYSTKKELKKQYQDLENANLQLSAQNTNLGMHIKSNQRLLNQQLQKNQKLIDEQYFAENQLQNNIWETAKKSTIKIDSASTSIIDLKEQATNALNDIYYLNLMGKDNVDSILNLNKDFANLTLPIKKFKIVIYLNYFLKDSLIKEYTNNFVIIPDSTEFPLVLSGDINGKVIHELIGTDMTKNALKVINFPELVEDFSHFSIAELHFFKKKDSNQLIDFKFKTEGELPTYFWHHRNYLRQKVTFTFDSLNSRTSLHNLYELFDNGYISIYLAKIFYKNESIEIKAKNLNGKNITFPIRVKSITISKRMEFYYGKNYENSKILEKKNNFTEPYYPFIRLARDQLNMYEDGILYHYVSFDNP